MAKKIMHGIDTLVNYEPRYSDAGGRRGHNAKVIMHKEDEKDFDGNVIHVIEFDDGTTLPVWPACIVPKKKF